MQNFNKKSPLIFLIFLFISNLAITTGNGQCDQNYDWAVWDNFLGNSATGSINQSGQTITMEIIANYNFDATSAIFNYPAFNGFNSNIPNATVPRTNWTAGVGGETIMCFSQVVTNPVLLLSSIGQTGIPVTLQLSLPYIPIYDGGGMTFVNDTTIIGREGYTILLFPGNFDCITIFSSTPEFYTNLTWGLNPPLFPISITGDSIACDSATLIASGGSTYLWSGGITPNSSSNTFIETGNYFLTVTDAAGCEVLTSVFVQIDSTLCVDCAGMPNGAAVIDDCGECLETTDPNFNRSCADCAGTPNGTAVLDDCGECFEPNDPNFNRSCADCAGTPNGTAVLDDCGECLEPNDPNFNLSCADCAGTPNGTAVLDDCGECFEPNDPNFNRSCTDCAGTLNGTAVLDDCGECFEPNDPNFNLSCASENLVYIPNAFSPNDDGLNDKFQLFARQGIVQQIKRYRIYNRWGELIYVALNFDHLSNDYWWDGNYKGEMVQVGVYIYKIEIELINGEIKEYAGKLLLTRKK